MQTNNAYLLRIYYNVNKNIHGIKMKYIIRGMHWFWVMAK